MNERLPIRPEQIVIPVGADELRKKFYTAKDRGEFLQTVDCWKCEGKLKLQELPFSYPIGPYDFYFGIIPMYHCSPCDENYFPGSVLDEIQKLAEQELASLNPQPRFRNPAVLAFNRRYREQSAT